MLENVHFTNMGKKFQHSVSLGQEVCWEVQILESSFFIIRFSFCHDLDSFFNFA